MGGRGQFKMKSDDDGWGGMGGYMRAKIQKLDEQFMQKAKEGDSLSTLFNGIAIHVNGFTDPSADKLKELMAQHGGKFHLYYSSTSTTYTIATHLPRAKIKSLRQHQTVLRPEWITESIKEGELQPIQSYIVAGSGFSRMHNRLTGLTIKKPPGRASKLEPNATCDSEGMSAAHSGVTSHDMPTSKQASTSSRSIVATADSSFLSEFYSHSRLHFLSTWKTELADYVRSLSNVDNDLSGQKELLKVATINPDRRYLKRNGRCIMHIDMDCFFVSVGLLSRPHLRGRPVAVTHHSANTASTNKQRPGTDPEFEKSYYERKRGKSNREEKHSLNRVESGKCPSVPSYSEIASCSYEARKAGLKNGMFYGKAKEMCPELVAIPYDFEAYRETSRKLYSILSSYTRSIEAVSCDEALLDMTQLVAQVGIHPLTIAQHIREKVKAVTGCNASAGIGPNITLARMATRVGKPNGQHHVTHDQVLSFIRDQPVKDLPGVGYATAARLVELGAPTCGQLQLISLSVLKKEFGIKSGQKLYDLARGTDSREVCQSKERKSVSADVNYGIRLQTDDQLNIFLANLSKEVSDRLRRAQVTGKKVTVKVMVRRTDAPTETAKFGGHGVCKSLSRSKTINFFTDDSNVIAKEANMIMKSLQVNISDLRGIGIQITQLQQINLVKSSTIDQFIKPRKEANTEDRERKVADISEPTNDKTNIETSADRQERPTSPLDVSSLEFPSGHPRSTFSITDDEMPSGQCGLPHSDDDEIPSSQPPESAVHFCKSPAGGVRAAFEDPADEIPSAQPNPSDYEAPFARCSQADEEDVSEDLHLTQPEYEIPCGQAVACIDNSLQIDTSEIEFPCSQGRPNEDPENDQVPSSQVTQEVIETPQDHDLSDMSNLAQPGIGAPPPPVARPPDAGPPAAAEENAEIAVNTSFLDALPQDIRVEVERDLKAQQMALLNSRPCVTNGNCEQAQSSKLHPRTSPSKKKPAQKAKLAKKGQKRKQAAANQKPTKGSPNKLITDMFSVITKPRQPQHTSTATGTHSHKNVRKKLNVNFSNGQEEPKAEEKGTVRSPPSLGGATTIPGARDAVRKWTSTFPASSPVESDVADVIDFLERLVVESRDLEGATLVLRTLYRSIMSTIEQCGIIDTQTHYDGRVTAWIEVYNRISGSLCDVVKLNYNGAILDVKRIA